jgi:hypothetical protein
MREKSPGAFFARNRSARCFSCSLLTLFFAFTLGCGVKKTVKVETSPRLLTAKDATLDQLLDLLRENAAKVTSLASNGLKVTFTSGRIESGKLQAYRSAPGYILLKRPDSFRLNVQNPITKTAVVELLSKEDEFSIWYPRENKFFIGKNSAKELDLGRTPSFTARPIHIFEAIMPKLVFLNQPDLRVALEEDQDTRDKYYILSLYRNVEGKRLFPLFRIWIERFGLTIAREQTFGERGQVVGDIHYSNQSSVAGVMLPLSVKLNRPEDGYALDFQFKSWRVNPDLPQDAFTMAPPSGAEQILLKEKKTGE